MRNIINGFYTLEFKDKMTIIISICALILSILSYLTSRKALNKNNTRLKLKQKRLNYEFLPVNFENKLVRHGTQSRELWKTPMAMYYLCVTLEIRNLSHSDITLGNFKINGEEIPSMSIINKNNIKNFNRNTGTEIQILWIPKFEEENSTRNFNIKFSSGSVDISEYNLIYPELRLKSKTTYTGLIFILLQENSYNIINDGKNKLTIETTDKKIHKKININKTPSMLND